MAIKPVHIRVGACYSNGEFGKNWTVWQVVDISLEDNEALQPNNHETVRYRILVGQNRRKYRLLTLEDFAHKVSYQVELVETTWQRVK